MRSKINPDFYLTPHKKVKSRSIRDQYGRDIVVKSVEKKSRRISLNLWDKE